MSRFAVTGGTGFVGSTLIELALAEGHSVRALTRRAQAPREGIEWIEGDLANAPALARLVEGADAVIHVAGVVNAPDRDGFAQGNVEGTRNTVRAAIDAKVLRFVHVSSLAAREPQLSNYGWSKAGAEALVTDAPLVWAVVRPPAVYGPGDMEMLDLFRMARRGLALLPPGGRLSVIHVEDLARLLLLLAQVDPGRFILEPDDGRERGWSHREFGRAIGAALGRRVAALSTPRPLLMAGAHLDRLMRGSRAKLTPDRVAYFCHQDWVANPARRPPTQFWQAKIPTDEGLAATATWYREQGLL